MRVLEAVEEGLREFPDFSAGVALGLAANLGAALDAARGRAAGGLLAPAGECADIAVVNGEPFGELGRGDEGQRFGVRGRGFREGRS